ncbi:MAG: amidohydrolase family protein [Mobilicoccus sp.]|nr:amidohydrolase family protein [Mobilicoccus sp.]
MSETVTFRHATYLDVEAGQWRTADIVVEEGRITRLDAPGSETGGAAHDLSGCRVLPGLIDCHVHVYASRADLGALAHDAPSYAALHAARLMGDMLDRGFTTVRDVAGGDFGLADAQTEGLLRGPRLFFGGKALSQTGGHGDFRDRGQRAMPDPMCCAALAVIADGPDEVRRAAREQLRTGAHHIKIMAGGGVASPTDRIDSLQYSEAEMAAAVEEAADADRYVAAHAYTPGAITRAIGAGVRSIEHANLMDEDSAQAVLDAGAFVTMNLVTYWALKEFGASMGLPAASVAKVERVLDAGRDALRLADEAGLDLCFGTDLLGDMQQHQSREFEIRARWQEPIDVIRAATSTAARLLQREGELGVIAEGAHADLLVLDGDPLEDISLLAEPHPELVVQAGRVVAGRGAELRSSSEVR